MRLLPIAMPTASLDTCVRSVSAGQVTPGHTKLRFGQPPAPPSKE